MIVLLFVLLFLALYLFVGGIAYQRWTVRAEGLCGSYNHKSCDHRIGASFAAALWFGAIPLLWGMKFASRGSK